MDLNETNADLSDFKSYVDFTTKKRDLFINKNA